MDVRKWMFRDKLSTNDDKTEPLVIRTRNQLAKVDIDRITIGNANITPQRLLSRMKVFGLDRNLFMDSHIDKT